MTTASGAALAGVALSATDLVIADAHGAAPFRAALQPPEGDRWPSLRDALQQYRTRRGTTGLTLRVALLPSLAEVRMVALPPVDDDDARRLLTRSAARHFLEVREAPVVSVAHRRASSAAAADDSAAAAALDERLAAAVASRTLTQVQNAAREAGSTIEVIVPAVMAWSLGLTPAVRGVQLSYDGQQTVLMVHAGQPVSLRRFRASGDEAALAEVTRAAGPLQTVTDAPLAAAMALASFTPAVGSLTFDRLDRTAPAATVVPRWLAPAVAAAVVAAAVVLGLEWRARSALAQLRAERAALAPQLARTAPQRLRAERARVLRVADSAYAPTVSRRMAALSTALPDAAYLTRLRVRGDSVLLEGRAVRAGLVWSALHAAPAVGRVSAAAPVRRETAIDGVPLDRFAFTLNGARTP